MGLLSTHIFKKFCVFSMSRFYSRSFVETLHFPSFCRVFAAKNEPSQSSLRDARFPLLSLRDIFLWPGEVFPLRGSF